MLIETPDKGQVENTLLSRALDKMAGPSNEAQYNNNLIINFTADTANNYLKSFKVSVILNTPQVYLKCKLV